MVDRDRLLRPGAGGARPISPLVGEMSAQLTEGGSSPQILNVPHTPLCPVGHLPHKGGDRWSVLAGLIGIDGADAPLPFRGRL